MNYIIKVCFPEPGVSLADGVDTLFSQMSPNDCVRALRKHVIGSDEIEAAFAGVDSPLCK